jgi:hypothetical protein
MAESEVDDGAYHSKLESLATIMEPIGGGVPRGAQNTAAATPATPASANLISANGRTAAGVGPGTIGGLGEYCNLNAWNS